MKTNTNSRRQALELLGAASLLTTTLRYAGAADDNQNTTPKVLFFSKSSGFEHDVVKRTK